MPLPNTNSDSKPLTSTSTSTSTSTADRQTSFHGMSPSSSSNTASDSKPEPTPNSTTSTTTPKAAPKVHFPQRQDRNAASAIAAQPRAMVENALVSQARNKKPADLQALKNFSANFKLTTPIPGDLVPILSNNLEKQKEIQARAWRNVPWAGTGRAGMNDAAGSGNGNGGQPGDK